MSKKQKITYCAIYTVDDSKHIPDIFFEIVTDPRLFEWNIMHREFLSKYCVDIDGLLCLDPSEKENDDGKAYINFIKNVPTLVIPSNKIGNVVTSRLEKYRTETENWLKKHNIQYNKLHMLDLPDAKTRRKKNSHATFKADIYRKITNAELFIESDEQQAVTISQLAGKPALCSNTQKIYYPGLSYALAEVRTRFLVYRIYNKVIKVFKKILGIQIN